MYCEKSKINTYGPLCFCGLGLVRERPRGFMARNFLSSQSMLLVMRSPACSYSHCMSIIIASLLNFPRNLAILLLGGRLHGGTTCVNPRNGSSANGQQSTVTRKPESLSEIPSIEEWLIKLHNFIALHSLTRLLKNQDLTQYKMTRYKLNVYFKAIINLSGLVL